MGFLNKFLGEERYDFEVRLYARWDRIHSDGSRLSHQQLWGVN